MAKPIPVPPGVLALMAQEKLCAQYRAVFGRPPGPGEPDARSEAQIAVWKDLEIAGYKNAPSFVPDRAGALCPIRAAMTDGRRALYLYIEANVKFAPKIEQQPQ